MERPLRILMLIWEFPPKISGGLGVAGAGLIKALVSRGVQVDVLLPKVAPSHKGHGATLLSAADMNVKEEMWTEQETITETFKKLEFGSHLVPYLPPQEFVKEVVTTSTRTVERTSKEREVAEGITLDGEYDEGIVGQVHKYALLAYQQATSGDYDVVHVHDWMTFPAGTLIQNSGHLPVIFHVHSLESDRNGLHGNSEVAQFERQSLEEAKYIVAVSERVKRSISEQFGVDQEIIEVIPNAFAGKFLSPPSLNGAIRIGFVGRLTHQKGPNYYLDIVKELKSRLPEAKFEVIGDGYLLPELKKKAHHLNLTRLVQFHGFLDHDQVMKRMKKLHLLVVPSVSEPFGLVILEALASGVPVVTSPHTGVAEFVTSLPQMDNWNVYELTQLCQRLVTDDKYRSEILKKCQEEAKQLSWDKAAERLQFLYREIAHK